MRQLLIAVILLAGAAPAAAWHEPNIVVILADDLGYGDVGFMGQTFTETPALDALAARGTIFTSAYSAAPNCAPSRAGLITGQYAPRHRVYTVGSSSRGNTKNRKLIPTRNRTSLDQGFVTLPEVLAANDYITASMGKWHLGDDPLDHGFATNVAGNKAGHPKSYHAPYSNPNLSDVEGEYLTDRLAEEAERFITNHAGDPFFLYLSFYSVHTPIQPRSDLLERYAAKASTHPGAAHKPKYAAMVAAMDEGVGRVMAALERHGLSEKTIVIFMSDNGGVGSLARNAPLRGAKGMLYEGGIRVPLVIAWPGHLAAGARCDEPVIAIDLFPTILELAGIEPIDSEPQPSMDGESLAALLHGDDAAIERDAIYWHFPAYLEANRRKGTWRTTPCGVIRAGNLKLIEYFEDGRLELYDLEHDIAETTNLANDRPEDTARLHEMMRRWRRETAAPVPTERNPEYKDRHEKDEPAN